MFSSQIFLRNGSSGENFAAVRVGKGESNAFMASPSKLRLLRVSGSNFTFKLEAVTVEKNYRKAF